MKNSKAKSPQHKAWETIRFNKKVKKRYGLGDNYTLQKIQKYIENFNPTNFVKEILLLSNHSEAFIAKKVQKPIYHIKRFLPSAIQSVVMNTPQIGKKVVVPEIISFMEKGSPKKVSKAGRPKGTKNKPKEVVNSESAFASFKHEGKDSVHDNLERLMLHPKSPKKGEVATLAGDLNFEFRLYGHKRLKRMNFHSFEDSYSVGKTNISNIRYVEQQKFLEKHSKFASKVSLTKGNINHFINKVKENTYIHLFLDYCNSLDKNEEYVREILKNNVVQVNGLVWLTFSTRSGSKDIKGRLPQMFKEFSNYKLEELKGKNIKKVSNGIYCYNKMYVMILRRVD